MLTGDVPSPADPPAGCRFHPRCRYAIDICRTTPPPTVEVRAGQTAVCHLATDATRAPHDGEGVLVTMVALEWGGSTAVRQCGMLLAALGVRVVHGGGSGADPNGVPDAHLDRRKERGQPADLLAEADLLITDGTGPVDDALAAGVDVVAITPFGLTGPDAGAPGGDLIASHAGGYAHYLDLVGGRPGPGAADPGTGGPGAARRRADGGGRGGAPGWRAGPARAL